MELPDIDCGECGFDSCNALSDAIEAKEASFNDCVILNDERRVILKIDGRDVPMKAFVRDFVKGTTMGMVKTLKKTDIKEGDVIELRIIVSADDLR